MIINGNVYVNIDVNQSNPDEILKCLVAAIHDYIDRCPAYSERKEKLNAYYRVLNEIDTASASLSFSGKGRKSQPSHS